MGTFFTDSSWWWIYENKGMNMENEVWYVVDWVNRDPCIFQETHPREKFLREINNNTIWNAIRCRGFHERAMLLWLARTIHYSWAGVFICVDTWKFLSSYHMYDYDRRTSSVIRELHIKEKHDVVDNHQILIQGPWNGIWCLQKWSNYRRKELVRICKYFGVYDMM